MAQRPKPKEQKKVIDATVIDEEILKYPYPDPGRQCGTTSLRTRSSPRSRR
jgi:hypothetical protein